jgi:hypothetical protein
VAGFRSLRERLAGPPDPDEVLPLSVLPHMRQPLMDWLAQADMPGYDTRNLWTTLCQMLKIDYTGTSENSFKAVVNAANQDNDLLLDLIDARLKLGFNYPQQQLDSLRVTLFFAGSGWRVSDSGKGLEQVVDETVRAAAMSAIRESQGSASQHLANAWAETFGKDRNPTQAHAEMIRAVESAAIPLVMPNNLKATLGTIIGQLDKQGALYTTDGASAASDGVAGTVSMMRMLWEQQTDRHGATPTIPAAQDRVEFLLPIAAALVHAFSTGAVRRVR